MNDDYVAGVLEALGGFYLFNNKIRKDIQPRFTIVCNIDRVRFVEKVVLYLKEKHRINFRTYDIRNKAVFSVSRLDSLERLIEFMDKNCLLKKNNQEAVKKQIRTKREKMERGKRFKTKMDIKKLYCNKCKEWTEHERLNTILWNCKRCNKERSIGKDVKYI